MQLLHHRIDPGSPGRSQDRVEALTELSSAQRNLNSAEYFVPHPPIVAPLLTTPISLLIIRLVERSSHF